MTYNAQLDSLSRRRQRLVMIIMDYCSRTFGVSPCTATGSGDTKCYNTSATCKDLANYQDKNKVNLLLNGDFASWTGDNPDNWTVINTEDANNYVTQSTGKCRIISDGSIVMGVKQYSMIKGHIYRAIVNVVTLTSGSLNLRVAGDSNIICTLDETGFKSYTFKAEADGLFQIESNGACDIIIDDVVFKEINAVRLSMTQKPLPFKDENIRPYLAKEPSYLATELNPEKSLTINARITYECNDEPDNDIGIDTYASERSWYPNAPGTFWGKWLARNPYYEGREVVDLDGFEGIPEAQYVRRINIIEQIDLSGDGKIKIICKDMMKKADEVKIPKPTSGKITDDPLASGAVTINCDDTADYTSSGYIRAKDSIIKYTGKTATSFTGCTWGYFGSKTESIAKDTKIQQCRVWESVNGVDICLDIIKNDVGIDISMIRETEFNSERDLWLLTFTFTRCISKPVSATKILANLQDVLMSNIFWDDERQVVRFKTFGVLNPAAGGDVSYPEITDSDNIIKIDIDNNEQSRISMAVIHYAIYDGISDDEKSENYQKSLIDYESALAGIDKYNKNIIKTILAPWFTSDIIASTIKNRLIRRFGNPAKRVTLSLELRDSRINAADIIKLTTSKIPGINGTPLPKQRYQILKRQQKSESQFEYIGLDTGWGKNYAFIAPAGQADWDSASESEKKYAYIGDTNNKLGVNNDDGFYMF